MINIYYRERKLIFETAALYVKLYEFLPELHTKNFVLLFVSEIDYEDICK